jgi:hypothetical protein
MLRRPQDACRDRIDEASRDEPVSFPPLAVAGVLHSSYRGVENIMDRVSRECDGGPPTGPAWHQDLLVSMGRPRTARPALFNQPQTDSLLEYLGFRHVYRSHFRFLLEWNRMAFLVRRLSTTIDEVDQAYRAFAERLAE